VYKSNFSTIIVPTIGTTDIGMVLKAPLLSTSIRDIMIYAKKAPKHVGNKKPRNRSLSS
jgi:hypothetical protein